ncbi:MAG: YheC/YheD family protein [Syntrophomonas sp.]|uniref:YheC/YheD family endospore coat-associated protein n=1 Tax=Syntrophomonas sp. TaxID=2053627 RepID=UPI00260F40F4|nr:YheC/YheD family protein [Syntrophomonas sp.]MDD2509790.1 YheC/YheD family protein [Syntrophomonas sp.]MDD3878898.1 YheC/YheD family protein [Syntrophomonas sp.]MDD4625717.1 YheC/YheD family protein [Syntrophomonas sp.]
MRKNENYICTVGVLSGNQKPHRNCPQGKKARIMKEMIIYAEKRQVLVYFFYSLDVDWRHQLIKGLRWKGNKWVSEFYAFPDIVYNRIPSRTLENRKVAQYLLQKFNEDENLYVFNSRYLDKWEVYQTLSNHPLGDELLPETRLFTYSNLEELMSRYSEVYLKPINSSRGKGIIKIKTTGANTYAYAHAEFPRTNWNRCFSFKALCEALNSLIAGKNDYLVQKGIELARFQDRIFDLRTQVQKDGEGKWLMTGVGVRVAGRNRIVTHIPNGGFLAAYDEVMLENFGPSKEIRQQLDWQLKRIAKQVPVILEKGLSINLDILSIDIGVDSNGKMWVIEANSKPASFDENDIRQRHLKYLVDYCIFIAQNKK